MAAPIPNGANFITMPTNLNITSLRLSQNDSITAFPGPCTCESATAKIMAKKTTWSTSFFAAASAKLCGTVCSRTPENVVFTFASSTPVSAVALARVTPAPGFTRFTATRPTTSAKVVTTSKYKIERKASLPTRFMSSPCPAMPTTSVENRSGTISDLIIRRNTDDSTCRSVAWKPFPSGPWSGKR